MCNKIVRPVRDFFRNMREPEYMASGDVYALMFFCDLVTFLIVVFGYASFGPSVSYSYLSCPKYVELACLLIWKKF